MNRIPTRTSKIVFVTVIAGWRRVVPDGSCRSRLSSALRISCRIPCEWVAAWWSSTRRGRHLADRVVDLRDRGRHDEVEEEPDRDEEGEVVDDHADAARHAVTAVEPLDARPHRRRDHDAEEEQRDHHPELPEHECCDRRSRGRRGSPSRSGVRFRRLQRDSLLQLERSGRGYAHRRGTPARDRARAPAPACASSSRSRARRASSRPGQPSGRGRAPARLAALIAVVAVAAGSGRTSSSPGTRSSSSTGSCAGAVRPSRSTGRCSRSSARCSAASSATEPCRRRARDRLRAAASHAPPPAAQVALAEHPFAG